MRRLHLALGALASLVLALAAVVRPAIADNHLPPSPTARVLVAQRVELLPQEPLCWTVFRNDLPPGGRWPTGDYAAAPLLAAYTSSGALRYDLSGGPTRTAAQGDAAFVGNNNWFAQTNTGTSPAATVGFALTCGSFPPSAPGFTLLGRTAPLPAIKTGPVPYQVTLSEFRRVPGERGPVRVNTYAAAIYMLEGTVAVSSPAGVTHYRPGDLITTPAGVPFQFGVPGGVAARYLVMELAAVGDAAVVDPPGASVPDPVTATATLATPPAIAAPVAVASASAPATSPAPAAAAATVPFGNGPLIRTVLIMPVLDNNRVPHSAAAWQELEQRLVTASGGFTVHAGVRGAYEAGGQIIEDESREYIVSIRSWTALQSWLDVMRWAKQRFGQNFLYVEVAGVPELL